MSPSLRPWRHGRPTRAQRASIAAARRGESGAVLFLALVFLTVIGLLTAALLSYAYTGTKTLTAYRLERTRRYAADSALVSTVFRLSQKTYALEGTNASMTQCGRIPISQYAPAGGGTVDVVVSGSYVTVWCQATPDVPTDNFDTDGGQAPRDITMEVRCNYSTSMVVSNRKLNCGAGSGSTVIGRARVRFEVDYDNASGVDKTKRAVVPKVLSWQIRI
ncbi:MAG: hypothetical protein ACTHN0_03705 [Aquihabitans sp.]